MILRGESPRRIPALIGLLFSIVQASFFASAQNAPAAPPNQASVSIIARDGPDEVINFAAAELRRYLQKMTGEKIIDAAKDAPHRIYLGGLPGSLSHAATTRLQSEIECLREDGFIFRTVGRNFVIAGIGTSREESMR